MPQLKIHGIEVNDICKVSFVMVQEMQELLECPRNYFTLECIDSKFIMDGEIVKPSAIIEVSWFDRGQEIQDAMAIIITKHIQSIGYKDLDVIFKLLEENKYYENGTHF